MEKGNRFGDLEINFKLAREKREWIVQRVAWVVIGLVVLTAMARLSNPVFRGLAVYFFLLLIFRVAGKPTLSQMTNFDLVLLLIISETTQEAMVQNDHSLRTCFLLIVTLVGATILLTALKEFFPKLELVLDGQPVVIVVHGELLKEVMVKSRVDEGDIMLAARRLHGLERLEQIKYAILERDGKISVIPKN